MAKIRKKSFDLFTVPNSGPHSPFLSTDFSPTSPAPPGTHNAAPGIVFILPVQPTCGKAQFYG